MKRVHPLDALFSFPPDLRRILSFVPKECIKNCPFSWWAHLGSNQGPTGYEPVALPAELWAHLYYMLSPETRGVNPIPIRILRSRSSEFGATNLMFGVERFTTPNIEHGMFPGNFSTSLPGWDAVTSLMPLPRSAGFFPG